MGSEEARGPTGEIGVLIKRLSKLFLHPVTMRGPRTQEPKVPEIAKLPELVDCPTPELQETIFSHL